MEAATAVELDKPIETRQYVAGVDVAQKVDFTVASVLVVESREMVYMDRFNRVEYPVLEDRLHAIYQRFNMAAMTIEDNSIGQGVIDHLRQRGMNIIPFHTSNTTKQAIIQGLAAAFEHGEIKILNDPILIGELQAFEGKRLAGGSFSYSAPEGLHDDTVMSLAIAWQGIAKTGSVVLW
jgi:phage terminase large subunit-like protein